MTFDQWLDIAMRGLDGTVAGRLVPEITEHYDAALEEALRGGVPSNDAESAAVKSLGNPIEMNAQYRKSYLTREEADWYQDFFDFPDIHEGFVAAFFSVVLLPVVLLYGVILGFYWGFIAGLLFGFIMLLMLHTAKSTKPDKWSVRFLKIAVLEILMAAMIYGLLEVALYEPGRWPGMGTMLFIIYLMSPSLKFYTALRLCRIEKKKAKV